MGFFSGKTKVYVDTTVMRVIEDNYIPDIPRKSLVDAITKGGSISENLLNNAYSGNYIKFERMHRWAADNYFAGLPNTKLISSVQGNVEAKQVIEAELGQEIELVYGIYQPANHYHWAWKELTHTYGYDHVTNEITAQSVTEGFTVYLDKMVVHYAVDATNLPDPAIRANLDRNPKWGYTPERKVDSAVGVLTAGEDWVDDIDGIDQVDVHYIWEDATGTIQRGVFVIPVAEAAEDVDYYQIKYIYTDELGVHINYWTYDPADGTYPVLDSQFDIDTSPIGTYFPFVFLRKNFLNVADDPNSTDPIFTTSQELCKRIGIDFVSLADKVNQNPDITDIKTAAIMMAVPITATDQESVRYLYDYFFRLAILTPDAPEYTLTVPEKTVRAGKTVFSRTGEAVITPSSTNYALRIADDEFELILRYSNISTSLKAGIIGEPGTYTNEYSDTYYPPAQTGRRRIPERYERVRILRRQISKNTYSEVYVYNPSVSYTVTGREVLGEGDDDNCLIPLDYDLAKNFSVLHREALYTKSLHMIFNSYKEVKSKWYQTSWFKTVLQIVGVVVTILSFGQDGGQTAAVLTALVSIGAYQLALMIILDMVLAFILDYLIYTLLINFIASQISPELALLLSVIAIGYGFSQGMNTGFGKETWSTELMKVGNLLMDASANELKMDTIKLFDEFAEFELMAAEKWDELAKIEDELSSDSLLDPFANIGKVPDIKIGEDTDTFYYRTVHLQNPGPVAFNFIENFVDISLTLPSTDSTLGDTYYV